MQPNWGDIHPGNLEMSDHSSINVGDIHTAAERDTDMQCTLPPLGHVVRFAKFAIICLRTDCSADIRPISWRFQFRIYDAACHNREICGKELPKASVCRYRIHCTPPL